MDIDRNFLAIDFETATFSRASVCEAGICVVRDGKRAETRSWLVRPEDNRYSYRNILIHGIRPEDTENAPGFVQVWEEIERTYLDEFDRAGDDAEMCARLFLKEMEDMDALGHNME